MYYEIRLQGTTELLGVQFFSAEAVKEAEECGFRLTKADNQDHISTYWVA